LIACGDAKSGTNDARILDLSASTSRTQNPLQRWQHGGYLLQEHSRFERYKRAKQSTTVYLDLTKCTYLDVRCDGEDYILIRSKNVLLVLLPNTAMYYAAQIIGPTISLCCQTSIQL